MKSSITKNTKKPKRRRTKKLINELKDQIEFYFSKANLIRSAHFRELAGKDGTTYVPLSTLMNFHMIERMNVDVQQMKKAVNSSYILELNPDGLSVKRYHSISSASKDLDACTLYMENLPNGTCLEWLKELTKKIGDVEYISLPRHKKSGRLKGFAFIEFSKPEEVTRACRIFEDPPTNFFPVITEQHKNIAKISRKTFKQSNKATFVESENTKTNVKKTKDQNNSLIDSLLSPCDEIRTIEVEEDDRNIKKRQGTRRRHSDMGNENKLNNDTEGHTPAKRAKSNPVNSIKGKTNKANIRTICEETENTTLLNQHVTSDSKSMKLNGILVTKNNEEILEQTKNHGKRVLFLNNNEYKCASEIKKSILENETVNLNEEIKFNEIKDVSTNDNKDVNGFNYTNATVQLSTQLKQRKYEHKVNYKVFEPLLKRKRSVSEPPQHSLSEVPDDLCTPAKLPKINDVSQENSSSLFSDIDKIVKKARTFAENQTAEEITTVASSQKKVPKPQVSSKIVDLSKKRSRKRSRRSKIWKELAKTKQKVPNIKVLSKLEWMEFKKQYKQLQRENLSKLKSSMREIKTTGTKSAFIKKHMDVLQSRNIEDEATGTSCDSSSSESSDSSSDGEMGDADKKDLNKKEETKQKMKGPPTYVSGVIIKICSIDETFLRKTEDNEVKSNISCIEKVREHLGKYGNIAYVETTNALKTIYVRYHKSEDAQKAILEERDLAINLLTGTEEEKYWEKLLLDRAKKYSRERPRVRGRTKLVLRAEKAMQDASRKHIRFDHDF